MKRLVIVFLLLAISLTTTLALAQEQFPPEKRKQAIQGLWKIDQQIQENIKMVDTLIRTTRILFNNGEEKQALKHLQDAKSAFQQLKTLNLKTIRDIKHNTLNEIIAESRIARAKKLEQKAYLYLYKAIKIANKQK